MTLDSPCFLVTVLFSTLQMQKLLTMNWRDLELLLELRYILGAGGALLGTWLLTYFYKQFRIKGKIRERYEECQASLKKLEEHVGENGVGVSDGNKTFRPQDVYPLVVSPLVVSPLFSTLVVWPHIP